MKIYIVGGAVRDMLLGRVPSDFDFVVQGSTKENFLNAFPGAVQVGRGFPVFLLDGEEYALARVERKVGVGHTGFEVRSSEEVSLQEDLLRRDLTINAMAMCPESGEVIPADDRCLIDLMNKVIRHTTSSTFIDDPLRVFRVARFAAQLPNFEVADETLVLMNKMRFDLGELSPQRVFNEMEKALVAPAPRKFFEVLLFSGCWDPWFTEIVNLKGVPVGPPEGKHAGEADCFQHIMNVMSRVSEDPALRFAALCHDLGKAYSEAPPKHPGHDKAGIAPINSLCDRLKVPNKYREAALLFCEEHMRMHKILEMGAGKAVALIMKIHKSMPGGLLGFLECSIADGMTMNEAQEIISRAQAVIDARLPKEFVGRGKACAEIMMQLRCKTWRNS